MSRRAILIVGVLAVSLVSGCGDTRTVTATVPIPSIDGIHVGDSASAVTYKLGYAADEVCLDAKRSCPDSTATYDHGRIQLTLKNGHVVSVGCPLSGSGCPKLTMPGGARLGEQVPFTGRWHGYRRYVPPDAQGDEFYWHQTVPGHKSMIASLTTERGRVSWLSVSDASYDRSFKPVHLTQSK